MTNSIQALSKILEIDFNDINLIKQAFVHRSYLNESSEYFVSNERLEFLGDAVLELITTEYLYTNYPNYQEGMLTNLRAALVRTTTLAELSSSLGVPSLLMISKGEEATGGRENQSILADTLESFIGALYLDSGIETVKKFLAKHLFVKTNDIIANSSYKDNKSLLQEYTQLHLKLTPSYTLVSEEGPDHDKTFRMQVELADKKYAIGVGKSKQLAQDDSAAKTLEILKNN